MNPSERADSSGGSDNPLGQNIPPPATTGAGFRARARSFTAPLTGAAETVTSAMPMPNLNPRGRSIPHDKTFPPHPTGEVGTNLPFRPLSQVPEMTVPSQREFSSDQPGFPNMHPSMQGSSRPPHRYSFPENIAASNLPGRTGGEPPNVSNPPALENNIPVPPQKAAHTSGAPGGPPHPYEQERHRQPSEFDHHPLPYAQQMQSQHPLFSLDPFRPVTPHSVPHPEPSPSQKPEAQQGPENGQNQGPVEFLDHVADKVVEKLRGLSVGDASEQGAPLPPTSFPPRSRNASVAAPIPPGVEGIYMGPGNFSERAPAQDATGYLPYDTPRHLSHNADQMRQSMDSSQGCNSGEMSNNVTNKQSLELAWGKLFTENGKPMMRLSQLLRGIAQYMTENYPPENTVVVTPSKMARFYGETKPEYEKHNWDEIFDENNAENLGRLYRALGAEYHLVQPNQDRAPALPALTPKGFDQWMSLMIQAYPDHEYQRIRNAVMLMPISNPENRAQKFPRDIPRRCFPLRKDMAIHSSVKHGLKECVIRESPNMPKTNGQASDPNMPVMPAIPPTMLHQQNMMREQSAAIGSEEALAAAALQDSPLLLERQRHPYSSAPGIVDVARKASPLNYAHPRVSEASRYDDLDLPPNSATSIYGESVPEPLQKPRIRSPPRLLSFERRHDPDLDETERHAVPPRNLRSLSRGRERLSSVERGRPVTPVPRYSERDEPAEDYDEVVPPRRIRRDSLSRGRSATRRPSVGRSFSQETHDQVARNKSRDRYESEDPYGDYYDYDTRSDPYRRPGYHRGPERGRAPPPPEYEYEKGKSPYPPRQPPYDYRMSGQGQYPPGPGYASGYGSSQPPNPYYPPATTTGAAGGSYNANGGYDGYMNDGMDPYYNGYYQSQQYGVDSGYPGAYSQAGMGDPYSAYQQQPGYGYGTGGPETTMPPATSAPDMFQQQQPNPYGMAPATMGTDPYSSMPNGAEARPPPAMGGDMRAQYGGSSGEYPAAPGPPPPADSHNGGSRGWQ